MENKQRGRKKLLALVFWVVDRKTDVIPLSSIPNKSERHEGATTLIPWKNDKGISKKYLAKILKIDAKAAHLESIVVNSKGEMCDKDQKAVSAEIMKEKRELAWEKKKSSASLLTADLASQRSVLETRSLYQSNTLLEGATSQGENESIHEDAATDDDDDEDDDKEEEDEGLPKEPAPDTITPALKAFMPEVTHENIVFMENLLSSMKKIYESQTNKVFAPPNPENLSAFKTPGDGKEPFYENSKCYLPSFLKAKIESDSVNYCFKTGVAIKQWKPLVRQVLMEIYGRSLSMFCAGGRANSRPGIDKLIYKELYVYASKFFGSPISEEDFKKFINSVSSNQRDKRSKKREEKPAETSTVVTGKVLGESTNISNSTVVTGKVLGESTISNPTVITGKVLGESSNSSPTLHNMQVPQLSINHQQHFNPTPASYPSASNIYIPPINSEQSSISVSQYYSDIYNSGTGFMHSGF